MHKGELYCTNLDNALPAVLNDRYSSSCGSSKLWQKQPAARLCKDHPAKQQQQRARVAAVLLPLVALKRNSLAPKQQQQQQQQQDGTAARSKAACRPDVQPSKTHRVLRHLVSTPLPQPSSPSDSRWKRCCAVRSMSK
jgi:hypothetical protein